MQTDNAVITDPFDLGKPEKSRPQVKLFDASENVIDLTETGTGKEQPFEESGFDRVGDWLGKHGPAISHLFLIIGSAAGTIYNAWHISHSAEVSIWQLIMTVLLFCGLIVECAFAYAWTKQGTTDLAGEQIATNRKMYNLSSAVMIGDLSLSLVEVALGVGGVSKFWVGIVQPLCAVGLVRLFYRLKGEHPMTKAKQQVATLKARMAAAEVQDEALNMRLTLDERKHDRYMKREALRLRHAEGQRLVGSRWFRKQIKEAVSESVGKEVLPGIKGKLKSLPKLLRLPRQRQN